MTSFLFHDGHCQWLPLEPNVTELGLARGLETVTVRCPVCTRTETYPTTPAVHLAVWRYRAAVAGAPVVAQAETILKEARR